MKLRSVAAAFFALASFAGCKPAVSGRCNTTKDCRQGAYCAVSGICLSRSGTCAPACGDGQICSSSVCVALKPPTVSVFVPVASDAVNGWVPRTAGTLEVRASVDDGAGAGAASATLSFDTCPASEACSYGGTVLSQTGGVTVFSFTVPRTVQAAGSEAPLAITVKAQDVAGNKAQGAGTVKIDDAPPQISALGLVPAGITGEDGKTWFVGGPGAPDVELSVPVADSGVGLSSLTLHLTDVAGPDPTPQPQSDGTVHFMLPASRVVGREGALHFTLTAADLLNHKVTTPPDNIWVDASAPVFTRPHVDYASALPASACAAETSTFNCGRRFLGSPALPTHALRDDTVPVTFDGFDCGAGLANSGSPFSLLVTSGGQMKPVSVQQTGKDNGTCANGNRIHHFSVQLALGAAVTALGVPSPDGTVPVQLASNGVDRVNNSGQSPAGTASPDGIALLSLWRWRIKLNAIASGSPALLPGTAGSRAVVIGTTAISGANLFAVGPDGTQLWSALLLPDVVGDVAVGQGGAVYASTDATCGAAATCTAVNFVAPPSGSTGAAVPCAAGNANFGASPAVVSAGSADLLYAIALARGPGASNLFVFSPAATCTQSGSAIVMPTTDDATGISAGPFAAFVSNGHGFTSLDENGTGFSTQVMYDAGNTSLVTRASPSISSASAAGGAIFGTGGGDQKVRRTVRQATGCGPTGLSACWTAAPGFPPPAPAPSNLPFTPVFDGQTIWTIDDQGVVFTWAQQGGAAGPFLDLSETASPPVLVQGGAALETTIGGLVKLLSVSGTAMSSQRLLDFGATFPALSKVPAPVIDCRAAGCSGSGVAYVPAPAGWVYAVQLPAAPVAASSTAWPRPGHDSCNTRNATADASKCP